MRAKSGSRFLNDWKSRESGEGLARTIARMNGSALQGNYQAIREQVGGLAILPMIKANGYGHGSVWAARQLLRMPDLYGLGVATLMEGAELREKLGPVARKTRILVFSGCLGWSEEMGQFCEEYSLTPVIGGEEDWKKFVKGKWPERLTYELKFNTGMNRLGLPVSLAGRLAKELRKMPPNQQPTGILSHLASAESPDLRLSQQQMERFLALRAELSGAIPAARFHLGNSAAIWNEKNWRLKELTDVVRPGLSLYGVPPWAGAPARGLVPVMTLTAKVLAVHRIKPGESVGYGGRFKVKGTESVPVAILGAGYGDGIHRMFSGTEKGPGGYVWAKGREERVLGTVSMDLSAISCSTDTKVGDWVEFLGPQVEPWAQANACGTIPYELLTSVSGRVQRMYD